LLTQAAAHEPPPGGVVVGGVVVGGAVVGGGVGLPPPLVNGWNACVKAPLDWLMPLHVEDA
jgi:hypothetical protein